MDNKETLLARIASQSASKEESAAFRPFFDEISEEQARQLLALDGFTTEYKIPIWNDEIGNPAHDPNKERDTPPDSYLKGTTPPRNIAEDLYILMLGAYSMEEVKGRIETAEKLDEVTAQYWHNIGLILGPASTVSRVNKVDFPLDKVNSNVWKLLEHDTGGQIAFAVEKQASKKPMNIYYSINFDALDKDISVSKRLEPFDKRVYAAVDALHRAGNVLISFSQIHYAIGNITRPAKTDIERIRKSVYKMRGANVYINNEEEAKAYKYDKVVIDGPLLPSFMKSGIINGKHVDEALALICEPPLMHFARRRKQITTIELKLLETPVSKTDQNLLIEDYLLERIAHAKKGTLSTKVLYETLYEEAQITTSKQRQRAWNKIQSILDHYVKCGHISGYKDEKDGVKLIL